MAEETFEERALADDLTAYVNDKHTQEECIGFIDGYKTALAKLKNLRLGIVVGQSEQLKILGRHIAEQYDIEESGVIEQLEWKSKNL